VAEDSIYYSGTFKSPIGDMNFMVTGNGEVAYLGFTDETDVVHRLFKSRAVSIKRDEERGGKLKKELEEYFAGKRKLFSVDIEMQGTVFQMKVWNALLDIPYGKTESYSSIARKVGHPRAERAVGTAVGSNRVSIIVPCHRVIKASGKIGNYGGGVDRKRYLLKLEGAKINKHNSF